MAKSLLPSTPAFDLTASDAAIARLLARVSPEDRPLCKLRSKSLAEIREKGPVRWLIEGVFQADAVNLIVGAPNQGKTFVAIDMALALANNLPWCGRNTEGGWVLYVAAEAEVSVVQRADAWLNFHGLDDDDALRILDHPVDLVAKESPAEFVGLLNAIQEDIKAKGSPPVAVFIDTLAQTFGSGDENSTRDMNAFVRSCDKIRRLFQTTVVVIHHTGKDATRGERGSSSLRGGVHGSIQVEQDQGTGIVSVQGRKQRDAEKLAPTHFEIVSIAWSDVGGGTRQAGVLLPLEAVVGADRPTKAEAVLAVLAAAGPTGLTGAEWEAAAAAAGIARSTFFDARKKALVSGRVVELDGRFVAVID